MEIIITDLTRFRTGNPHVCTAGVNSEGTVIRPKPYLKVADIEKFNIHPGGRLKSKFVLEGSSRPHVEDASHGKLKYLGPCTSSQFKEALEATLHESVADGFEYDLERGEKCIPIDESPPRSIITIKVCPTAFTIVQNSYNSKQIKAHFSDNSGAQFSFVSITDKGFYDYAVQFHDQPSKIAKISRFTQQQDELYLRIGLSQPYQTTDGRHGYWIQVNGVYTFPKYLKTVRKHDG